jgi:release factor glutamine methyltransferase
VRVADEKTVMFGPLVIQYDPDGLAPRAWTQLQSHWAAELLGELPEGDVLELGAGPGQIGLLALVEADAGSDAPSRRRRRRRLVQVDEDQAACGLAERNAAAAELTDRVDVRCGVAEDALHPDERFALVIADPPWVRTDRVDDYPDDPPPAIDGGPGRAKVPLDDREK